jgi:hypothetical protein
VNGAARGHLYESPEDLAARYPLEVGDVVLTAGNSWLGRAIRWAERTRGEAPTRINHAAICVAAPDVIVEADKVVRRGSVWDYHYEDDVVVWRPTNLTDVERLTLAAVAVSRIGEKYPARQLLAYLVDNKVLNGRNVVRRWIGNEAGGVCSRLVARCFKQIRRDFGVPEYAASPDAMDDFALANPDKYTCPWTRAGIKRS